MAPKGKKKNFSWEKGSQLSQDEYDALGNVRDVGFNKLADGIYADPVKRKEARGKRLSGSAKLTDRGFFKEESESGLHEEYTPSEASRLIRKESRGFKGIQRFKKLSAKKKKSPEKTK